MSLSAERPRTALEMGVMEQNAIALGISLDTLMENAGRAVAEEASKRLPTPPARVAIVAGTGNNGGDGTCAAFYLAQWGYSPEVWLVRPALEIRSRAARRCWERVERLCPTHLRAPRSEELSGVPLAIDAMLGTGQRGELRPPYSDTAVALRTSGAPVLAVDVPTGLGASNGVRARWTVALTSLKEGMTEETCGTIIVRDIGIPVEAYRRTGPGDFLFFPTRLSPVERGRDARIVIIGGGPYAGAPALAALAALRSGAERATVIAPMPAAETIQGFSPNIVVHPVGEGRFRPEDVPKIQEFLHSAPPSTVVVGMGAGADAGTVEALRKIEAELDGHIPLLIDADGLHGLRTPASTNSDRRATAIVATPNEGEYRRVFDGTPEGGVEDRLEDARRIAAAWRITLIVKGEADLLSDGEEAFLNFHHHSSMTVSGVGDVLAGVVGSLLGQGLAPLAAARLGTYWVGDAGGRAAAEKSYSLLATDVIEKLPNALVAGLERVRPSV